MIRDARDRLVGLFFKFWIIAQRGRDSGYVKNMEGNPHVRVKVNREWRAGTAHILDDDDPTNASESSDEAISPAGSVFAPRTG